jgi:hypothetical protein
MNTDASELMAEALKRVDLKGHFSPEQIGAKVGLSKMRAEAAARVLSNQGILVLGFDCAAHFSPDFRKAKMKSEASESAAATSAKPRRRASSSRKVSA